MTVVLALALLANPAVTYDADMDDDARFDPVQAHSNMPAGWEPEPFASAASAIAKMTHRSTPTIILEIRVLHTVSDDQNRDRRQALHDIIDALGQARGSKKRLPFRKNSGHPMKDNQRKHRENKNKALT